MAKITTPIARAAEVATLIPLSTARKPFDPPPPEPVSPLEVVGGVVLVVGLVAADTVTGGVLSGLASIPAPQCQDEPPVVVPVVPGMTAAPTTDDRGNVQCTRCRELVEYASMSLNEDGYFCAWCAAALDALAGGG